MCVCVCVCVCVIIYYALLKNCMLNLTLTVLSSNVVDQFDPLCLLRTSFNPYILIDYKYTLHVANVASIRVHS